MQELDPPLVPPAELVTTGPTSPPIPASPPTPRRPLRAAQRRTAMTATCLLALLPVSTVLAIGAGAVAISPTDVVAVLWHHTSAWLPVPAPAAVDPTQDQIIWSVRTPRVLLALVTGAGLAVAGAVLQAVVRNPLADPYVLGVSAGASAAAVAVLTLGAAAGLTASAAAFVGAVTALVLVLALGQRAGHIDPSRLLLAGVALGYLFQAVTSYLQLRQGGAKLQALLFWLLGTLSSAQWATLGPPTAVVAVATGWLLLRARALNALVLGEEVASSLGLRVGLLRVQLLVVAALLTGAVIAVAGGVGFVGLVAPHAVRLLVGGDHRRLLPLSALAGGVFLILADLVGRTAAQPLELPLTVVTAIAGVPFFLVLLHRSSSSAGRTA